LDEVAPFVSAQGLGDWIQRLNKVSDDYVAVEWEVVLLRAFAKFGKIMHEPPLGGRPIDLVFESFDGKVKFGADIAAISDDTLHERNPVDRFRDELSRRIRKSKIQTGRFLFEVGEEQPVPWRGIGRKRRLLLPAVNQFQTVVFNAAFDGYLEAIRKSPNQVHNHNVHHPSPAVKLVIQYQPGVGSGVGTLSYGVYTGTTVKDDNPLFNRLKEKAVQLRQSGYSGLRGIVACDRGSRIFADLADWSTYKMVEVVEEFFRQNTSVDFVLTIGVKSTSSTFGRGFHLNFDPKLFVRDTSESWVADLDRLCAQAVSSLPAMHQTPENAVNEMKWNQSTLRTKPFLGGSMLSGNTIRISTRELLDLLAGKLDQNRFAEHHKIANGENIFKVYQSKGKMIERAEVGRRKDEDDDWITFEFSDSDPAVSRFRVPKSSNSGTQGT
jgi:hypothetical protein